MAICYRSRSFSNTSQSAGTARIRRLSLHSQSLPRPAICLPELCPLLQLCPLYRAFSASLPSWNWPSLLPAQKVASLTFRKQSSSQSQPQPQIRRGTFWVPLLSREPAFHPASGCPAAEPLLLLALLPRTPPATCVNTAHLQDRCKWHLTHAAPPAPHDLETSRTVGLCPSTVLNALTLGEILPQGPG